MKILFYKLVVLIIAMLGLVSCSTLKPVYDSIDKSNFGGNNANSVVVRNPQLLKTGSPGLYINASIPVIAGGAIGYTAKYEGKQMGALGAVIGGCIGFGISSYAVGAYANKAKLGGKQPLNSADELKVWLKKHSSKTSTQYISAYGYSGDSKNLIIVPSSSEKTFTAHNFEEVKFFKEKFPNSQYASSFIERSAAVANDQGLGALINYYNDYQVIDIVKKQYVLRAPNIALLIERQKSYANLVSNDEAMLAATTKINSISDIERYRGRFGLSTTYDNSIYNLLYPNLDEYDLKKLINIFPYASKRSEAISLLISKTSSHSLLRSHLVDFGEEWAANIYARGEEIITDYKLLKNFIKELPEAPRLHKTYGGYYLGSWDNNNNFAHGWGIELEIDDSSNSTKDDYSIGNFVQGKIEGKDCKLYWNNGAELTYSGECSESVPWGNGTGSGDYIYRRYPFNDKNVSYTGQWAEGRPNGLGKMAGSDTWVEGNFKAGYPNGYSVMRTPGGFRISGNWGGLGQPAGKMTIEKWTLMGLISSSETVDAHTWEDIENAMRRVAKDFRSQLRPSSSGSSSSTTNNSSNSTSKNDEEEFELCAMSTPKCETNNLYPGAEDTSGWDGITKVHIEFKDGVSGALFKTRNGKYKVSKDKIWSAEYENFDDALKALYYFKKCGHFSPSGRVYCN